MGGGDGDDARLATIADDARPAARAYLSDERLARAIFAGDHRHPLVYDATMILRFRSSDYTRFLVHAIDGRALFRRALQSRDATAIQCWLRYARHAGISLDNYVAALVAFATEAKYCVVCACFFGDDDDDDHTKRCLPAAAKYSVGGRQLYS